MVDCKLYALFIFRKGSAKTNSFLPFCKQRSRKQLPDSSRPSCQRSLSFRIVIGGAGSVFFLCKLFTSGTVMAKSFRLFDVTIEIIQGKFHHGYKSKIGYTEKWSYPRVTSHFPEVKSSSVTTATVTYGRFYTRGCIIRLDELWRTFVVCSPYAQNYTKEESNDCRIKRLREYKESILTQSEMS